MLQTFKQNRAIRLKKCILFQDFRKDFRVALVILMLLNEYRARKALLLDTLFYIFTNGY